MKGVVTSKEINFLTQFATIQILQNIINSLSIFPKPRNLKDTQLNGIGICLIEYNFLYTIIINIKSFMQV